MATYGKTWWGKAWLDALSRIDNSNRLPRGRSYANTGKVKSIEIVAGNISAKVQGSSPRPYKVSFSLSQYTNREKEMLIEAVTENPAMLAKLLNRELPPELTEVTRQNGIALFPKDWREMNMKCSCPDYAVPCKHLAAVMYSLSAEIDQNPFSILNYHGLDLLKELATRQITTGGNSGIIVPKWQGYLESKPSGEVPLDYSLFDNLSFATIPDLSQKLIQILSDNPIFYDKDYKIKLSKGYTTVQKGMDKWTKEDVISNSSLILTPNTTLKIVFGESAQLSVVRLYEEAGQETEEDSPPAKTPSATEYSSIEQLKNQLYRMDSAKHSELSDSLRAFHLCHLFCIELLQKGAFVPEMLETAENVYQIRWLPARNAAEVNALLSQVARVVPAQLIEIKIGKKEYHQSAENQTLTLCSLILGYYVKMFSISLAKKITYGRKYEWVYEEWDEFFFQQTPKSFPKKNDETPIAIQNWLSPFYIIKKDFVPTLEITDEDDYFEVDILIEDNRETETKAPILFSKILKEKQYHDIRFEVLQDLMRLQTHFPELNTVLQSKGATKTRIMREDFAPVLIKTLPIMQLIGIQILLPKSLKHWVRPQASGSLSVKNKDTINTFMHLDEMLSFDWRIAIGDELLTWSEFQKMVKGVSGLVKIKDLYVLIEPDELEKLKKRLESPTKPEGNDLLKIALAGQYQGSKVGIPDTVLNFIQKITESETEKLPDGLLATLRPYQQKGYEWMIKNAKLGLGSLIADDMGLGKTLQVIAVLLQFKRENKFTEKQKGLVVVPTTLLTNWEKEIRKFAPDLNVSIYHGTKRVLNTENADIVLTTYGLIRNEINLFKKYHWYSIVIDEAQNIKNHGTDQTKAVKSLKSEIKIAMSGTPVENRLSEFWSILDFTYKGYLGGLNKFVQEFAKPIQLERNLEQLNTFKKITAPFMMRRLKTDKTIISDLPSKIEQNNYCTLAPKQTALYESVVKQTLSDIENAEGIARKGLVLKLMIALKQVGNHPAQYLEKYEKDPNLSGKTQLLLQILENIHENQEKTIIFTQFKVMGEILSEFIQNHFGRKPLFLHGGTSRKQRDEMVERFQNQRLDTIFILSLKAGGTGLNLTAANHVIHYDLWWNPAVESQATDRAFRIGQQKNVMVYRLINQGTIEEKIDNMIQEKRTIADMSVQTGETWIGDLSNDELKQLIKLTTE